MLASTKKQTNGSNADAGQTAKSITHTDRQENTAGAARTTVTRRTDMTEKELLKSALGKMIKARQLVKDAESELESIGIELVCDPTLETELNCSGKKYELHIYSGLKKLSELLGTDIYHNRNKKYESGAHSCEVSEGDFFFYEITEKDGSLK